MSRFPVERLAFFNFKRVIDFTFDDVRKRSIYESGEKKNSNTQHQKFVLNSYGGWVNLLLDDSENKSVTFFNSWAPSVVGVCKLPCLSLRELRRRPLQAPR